MLVQMMGAAEGRDDWVASTASTPPLLELVRSSSVASSSEGGELGEERKLDEPVVKCDHELGNADKPTTGDNETRQHTTTTCQARTSRSAPADEEATMRTDENKGEYSANTTEHTAALTSPKAELIVTTSTHETTKPRNSPPTLSNRRIDVRLLVRRREAGALIGKRGANIKRMRETYKNSTFNIPDTGNGPERIVCIGGESWQSLEAILLEISQLFLDKSSVLHMGGAQEEQVELKQLINSAYAGLLIGIGGQSIRKLRNDSRAAIKIYEMCCPLSDERVCAIKARPLVVVSTIRLIHDMMLASQATIKAPLQAHKLYDALNFDPGLVDKYGGYVSEDCCSVEFVERLGGVAPSANCSLNLNGSLHSGPDQLNSYPPQHGHHMHQQQHHLHHHHHRHHPSICHQPSQVAFDMLAAAAASEPGLAPGLVIPSPSSYRPALFSPFQSINYVPFHSVVPDGCKLIKNHVDQTTAHRFVPGQPPDLHHNGSNQDQRRSRSALAQNHRNQRYQPYSMGDGLQAHFRHLRQHQQQAMFSTQLASLDRVNQQQHLQLQMKHIAQEQQSRIEEHHRFASIGVPSQLPSTNTHELLSCTGSEHANVRADQLLDGYHARMETNTGCIMSELMHNHVNQTTGPAIMQENQQLKQLYRLEEGGNFNGRHAGLLDNYTHHEQDKSRPLACELVSSHDDANAAPS